MKLNRQFIAPLYRALETFANREQARFFVPGHKGGRSLPDAFKARLAEFDVTNLPDTDTLHCPNGPIAEAQTLLAEAYGADRSFILVGGSTSGNIGSVMATLSPGESVLVQRNSHKSVIAGIVHAGARPIWLSPLVEDRFNIALGLSAAQVEEAFSRHPQAKAVAVLHPTYFGTVSDLAAIAEVCRKHDKLLLVDEAHGPHFHFHPELPVAAEDVGASTVVQSTHKVLSGLGQAAVLHIDTRRVDEERVQKVLQLTQTTSPNFAIMASIDIARRQMATHGGQLLQSTLKRARRARAALAAIPGLEVLGKEHQHGAGSGFFGQDETKIVLGVDGLGLNGLDVQRTLNRDFAVQPELAGANHLLFILSLGNTDEDIDRLVEAMRSIASSGSRQGARALDVALFQQLLSIDPEVAMLPREAFYAPSRSVPFDGSAGQICAEVVTPYPPGIPVLMPGERISREIIAALTHIQAMGNPVSASDLTLRSIRVVDGA